MTKETRLFPIKLNFDPIFKERIIPRDELKLCTTRQPSEWKDENEQKPKKTREAAENLMCQTIHLYCKVKFVNNEVL